LEEQLGVEHGLNYAAFGSAAGAEFRHNPQRLSEPFGLILTKPELWAPTIHMINTNSADNRTVGQPPVLHQETVSRLLECPCTPQRKIDVAAGTIDGKPAHPPIQCSKEFDATGNPSCHLSTYEGGWRCCEDGVFLIDTDKECQTPECTEKVTDTVYMRFTFYYKDADTSTRNVEASSCCDVTADAQIQGNENIEYDIPQCAEGTPPEQCVHVAESLQPVGYHWRRPAGHATGRPGDLVDLVFAAPHLHWAGTSLELIDPATNKTLCEVHRSDDNKHGIMYGTGSEPGNENGYLVGLTPCNWNSKEAPRFRRDHLLKIRAVYNASTSHTGVMSLWLMQVSAVPDAVLV